MLPIPTPRIIYWALTPKSPAPVRCILLLFFLVYLLSKANHLFPWQKNFPTRLLLLIRGELSFLPGKEYHRSKLSDLCVANCLFPWQKNFPTRLLRLIRGELSFLPGKEYHRSKLSDLCAANRLFFS